MLSPETMDVEVEVGSPLVLEVVIFGFNLPITEITWMQDSALLQDGMNDFTIMNDSLAMPNGTSTLTVVAVSPALHSGIYEVSVINPADSDSSTFTVTVSGNQYHYFKSYIAIHILYYSIIAPPSIVAPDQDVSIEVNETDTVLLTCVARGFPAPTVAWYLGTLSESDRLTSDGRIEIVTSDPVDDSDGFFVVTSNLTIPNSNRRDTGVYICGANNTVLEQDRVEVRMFDLTVNCKLALYYNNNSLDCSLPHRALLPQNYYIYAHSSNFS